MNASLVLRYASTLCQILHMDMWLSITLHLTVRSFAPLPLQKFHHYYDLGWLLTIRCYYAYFTAWRSPPRVSALVRPHGISHTSFLVYLLDLRLQVTVTFLDFSALCHLIPCNRLSINFLFVRPQFRYVFLSPVPHDTQSWQSLSGSPVTGVPWDFHPRCTTCPSYKGRILFLP